MKARLANIFNKKICAFFQTQVFVCYISAKLLFDQNNAGGNSQSIIFPTVNIDDKQPIIRRPYNGCPTVLFDQSCFCAIDEHRRQVCVFCVEVCYRAICFLGKVQTPSVFIQIYYIVKTAAIKFKPFRDICRVEITLALIVFMVLDYITGLMCAVIDKKLSSAVGFKGICKKVLILMLVGVANVVDIHIVGTGSALRSAVICFYLSNEGLSLLENAAHIGLPIPDKMKDVLAQLHGRTDEKKDETQEDEQK